MVFTQGFMYWLNSLASGNGRLKFRSSREAADYVRRIHNEQGGPNAKIIALRKRYNDVIQTKKAKDQNQPRGSGHTAV
jgi:hypothetical protein